MIERRTLVSLLIVFAMLWLAGCSEGAGMETDPEENALTEDEASAEYIAVTDQSAGGSILVFDPEVGDWNSSEAVKWSWRPGADNGFSDDEPGWGYPSGVKLRHSELHGGQVMLVVDSDGFAGIVPSPAGDARLWSQVVPGNLPSGRIALTVPKAGGVHAWTTDTVHVLLPDSSTRTRDGAGFYKARVWNSAYQ
ncbi:hypothetical protein M6D81_24535 [Paenibacillus sp. J5C_2022]|uniref:hypothetical protein n=1 Tax=Paenibacillus sp. J5C2022 TaxID=2977129 RepID=UPI0021D23DEC|nr:hypothetical protein [Paenibacillus sp. J5C2022]MCU6711873.1 hypothetical protein [Paenibacillus sp. J5C2022]